MEVTALTTKRQSGKCIFREKLMNLFAGQATVAAISFKINQNICAFQVNYTTNAEPSWNCGNEGTGGTACPEALNYGVGKIPEMK
jgi:hypothetical protein